MAEKITDTARESREKPLAYIGGMMAMGSNNFIEDMEKQGQREVARSEQIPKKSNLTDDQLRTLGFELLPDDGSDPLFRPARLPEGWKVVPTEHAMWSDVLDANCKRRGSIFYKAAHYDRKASLDVHPRFSVHTRFSEYDVVVTDCGEVAFVFDTLPPSPGPDVDRATASEMYARQIAVSDAAMAWLTERYPDWRNPLAYWDVPTPTREGV